MNFIFKHPLSLSNKLCSFQYENTGFGPGHPGQIPSSRSNWIVGPGPGPGKIEIIGPGPGKLIISVPVPVPVRPEIMSRSITDSTERKLPILSFTTFGWVPSPFAPYSCRALIVSSQLEHGETPRELLNISS